MLILVILIGGIIEVEVVEKLLILGKVDFVGVGRVMFRDLMWVKKVIESLR